MADPGAGEVLRQAESELRSGHWQAARDRAGPYENDRAHGVRARSVLANAAMQLGDFAEAVNQFRWLAEARPDHLKIRSALSMALNNLGSLRLQEGAADEAEACYRDAVEVDDGNAIAWFNLAACAQRRADFQLAARAYRRCVTLDGSRTEARLQWAVCERMNGDPGQAREALRGFDTVLRSLGGKVACAVGAEWDMLGDQDAAGRAYRQAVEAGGEDAGLLLRIARAQLHSGDLRAARVTSAAAKLRAGNTATALQATLVGALGLPCVPRDMDEIVRSREAFAQGVELLETEWPASRLRNSGLRLDDIAHSHYQLAYQGQDDLRLAKAFGQWYCAAASAVTGGEDWVSASAGKDRTVALVSSRWNRGTVCAYFGSWVAALAAAGWETHVFHLGQGTDPWTRDVAGQANLFHHVPGSLESVARAIRSTAPGVVLYPEVGLSGRVHALAALRLAPVQVAAWGHPVSTGLESIDWFFSSAEMEPEDAADMYTERLALLPRLGTRYRRPQRETPADRDELGLATRRPLFIVPHAAVKVRPDFDVLLVDIARAEPGAQFVLFQDSIRSLTLRLQERFTERFQACGIDPERHLTWLPHVSARRFRSVLAGGDAMLDMPGFSGGNSSLDAISQGLPVVTLPGTTMRSCQSAGMLRLCGAGGLIANDGQDYVNRAIRVATDAEFAHDCRQTLLRTSLFDDDQPLRSLVEWFEGLAP